MFIFNFAGKRSVKNFSRFRGRGVFGDASSDGKLLAAGCKIPVVKIFQTDTKAQLRVLEGHGLCKS